MIGAAELAEDSRFATNAARVDNRDALVAELQRHLAADTVAGWIVRMGGAGIPAGKVNVHSKGSLSRRNRSAFP